MITVYYYLLQNLVPSTKERGRNGRRNFPSNYASANNGRSATFRRQSRANHIVGGSRTALPAPNKAINDTIPCSMKAPNPISTTVPCFLAMLTILLIAITSQGAGEFLGASVLSIKRVGVIPSLVLLLFLLTGGYYVQHIPKFMQWLKYLSFMHYGFRLLSKVQYSAQVFKCGSKGGCRTLQSSSSFDTVNLNGGLEELWFLLAMAFGYRLWDASAFAIKTPFPIHDKNM